MTKILVAVPTFESIYPDTLKSIYNLIKPPGCEIVFDYIRGYDCAAARNNIVIKAQEIHADYILMVDSDIVLKPETIVWMMDDVKDVCLGYYAHRGANNEYEGNTCVCRVYKENGERYFNYPIESEYSAEEMKEFRKNGEFKIQIHGGGAGCAFIRTSIVNRMDYPWYHWVNYDNRQVLSEDLYFCEQCKNLDIPVYTDSRVECGHIFRKVQWCD